MADPLECPSCRFANAPGADRCAHCGAPLAESPDRVHPGETLRDPDDLTLPSSPLLRAVLRGDPDAAPPTRVLKPAAAKPDDRTAAAAAAERAPARTGGPAPTETDAGADDGGADVGAAAPVQPPAAASASPGPPSAAAPASAAADPAGVPPTSTPPRPVTRTTLRDLDAADQAALLRDLAERLQVRRAAAEVRYAGFVVRVVAFLIDGAVLLAFSLPLTAAGYLGIRAGLLALGEGDAVEADETLMTFFTAAWLAMGAVYFTALHRATGQTIGKALLGLRVLTIDLDGLGYFRALFRTLCYALSSSFLGFGFLLVALTPRKRGWHDFLAGTCVVHLAPEEAAT